MNAENDELFVNEAVNAIGLLVELLKRCDPLQVISRTAVFIISGNPDVQEPELPEKNETHLEYLISLAAALPFPTDAQEPAFEDIEEVIDLITRIHIRTSAHYISRSAKSSAPLDEIADAFRISRLHVRGDGYWPHLRKTMTDILFPHDVKLQGLLGFTSRNFFQFFECAEETLNQRVSARVKTHVVPLRNIMRMLRKRFESEGDSCSFEDLVAENLKEISAAKRKFDAFGAPDLFVVTPRTEEEKSMLAALSCSFGENAAFHGRGSEDKFWPLTSSITERRPIIFHNGIYYAFHLPAIMRGAYDLISNLVREADPDYWKHRFLSLRDEYLENETSRLLAVALPHAEIFKGFTYRIPDQSSEPDVDVLVSCDDFLLVVECKAGNLKASAKRGAPLSLKSGIKETVGKAHSQGERLIKTLVEQGSMTLRSKCGGAQTILRVEDFKYIINVSVTLDFLNPATTMMWTLEEAGIIEGSEKCWSVSLNDLRVIVDILDSPSLFLHYLIRRIDLNELRQVQACDELDYLMHYIDFGLFFREQNQPKEAEEVTLSRFTGNLDQFYRRVEGISHIGKKPKPKLGNRTKQIIATLERVRPRHYISACLSILEFDIPPRERLLGNLSRHLSILRDQNSAFGFTLVGNETSRTALAIATARGQNLHADLVRERAIQHCRENNFEQMCVILQGVPLGSGLVQVILVEPNSSTSRHAVHMLNKLVFVTRG